LNSIDSLLSTATDAPLISYRQQTETQASIADRVDSMVTRLRKWDGLQGNRFAVLTEENPITFYILLLALLKINQRVILPTRDFFTTPKSISYYSYTVNCIGTEVCIEANPAFMPVDIPEKGDMVAFSSGSTGIPKGILHEHTHFLSNARAVSKRILENGVNSLTFLKPYLVSALSHFFVHFLTNSHLRFEDYENLPALAEHYNNEHNLGIVGSPMHITSALQFIPPGTMPRYFFSSGDFFSAASTKRIFSLFSDTVMYNVYGLAELAGRFFINRIDAATPVEQYEITGSPIDGTNYRIDNDQLSVSSDFLFKGYIRGSCFEPAATWHPSQDLIEQGEHGLFLIGRANDEIKVMGNKVSLKHIENRIKKALDRDVAVVLASKHPHYGNILSLVLDDCTGLIRTELIRQLRTILEPAEIPHQFLVIDDIPFNQSMKIDRVTIANRLDSLRAIA
jgi:acyl-coenzyme A synthetase/AMP-(fatty) acid ligase